MTKKNNTNSSVGKIYVALKEEGTEVWKPVEASEIENGIYKIVSENITPEEELWEFNAGDLVRCVDKKFSDGTKGLVAIEKVEDVT